MPCIFIKSLDDILILRNTSDRFFNFLHNSCVWWMTCWLNYFTVYGKGWAMYPTPVEVSIALQVSKDVTLFTVIEPE